MDIEYLLFLQDFRRSINDALTPFMEWVSLFGVSYILLLPVFVYWCLDKRKGLFILAAWKISATLNALAKLTACVYRPWIRDPRIVPAGDSIKTAGGYSFPSGHTMTATPIYGGLAMFSGRCKQLRAFWIAAILVTGFSRNYLGVHTPQDVLVGLALGGLSLYAAARLSGYLEAHPEREDRVLLAGFVVGVLGLLYATYKPYPMDYVDGKLLVDPVRMSRTAWEDIGGLLALVAARYVERRWVRFSPVGLNAKGAVLCALGMIPLCFIIAGAKGFMVGLLGIHWGRLAAQGILFFYVMVLWPLAMKLVCRGKMRLGAPSIAPIIFLAALSLALGSAFYPWRAAAQEARPRSPGGRKWWQRTAVYQIYPKSFMDTTGNGAGDLPGVVSRLDHIRELGVGAIWLTPIYPSPMVDNGYDIADYTGIDPAYGTMEDFERLVAEAKKRGIRIVMDLVFNHSSDRHPWFLESKKDRTNPKADWYVWRDPKPGGGAPTNWRGIFGGSAWTWCEERGQYYLHTFAAQQPDLNWENPEVRRALYDAARFWLDKGVGGFRIDAVTYIKKPNEFKDGEPDGKDGMAGVHAMTANTPGILDFLREFRRAILDVPEGAAPRDIFTVGEANGVSPEELGDWVGEKGVFDMLFEFSHMLLPFQSGENWCYPREWKLTELKRALMASQNATREDGWAPIFFENHDQPRSPGRFFPKGADPKRAAKAMATVLLTLRGTPFIYQGQELGMTNVAWPSIEDYDDISSHGQYQFALKEGFTPQQAMGFVHTFSRDNARTPMQWDAGPNAGFAAKGVRPWLPVNENYPAVNAEAEAGDPDSVLSWYRRLGALRREREELTAGACEELLPESEEVFAFARTLGERQLVTAVNFSLDEVKLPQGFAEGWELLLSSEGASDPTAPFRPLEARIYSANGH